MAFGYYLLKVFVCSGALYLYYLLALKNRLFHQWNRFYLLSATVLSIVLPLVQFAILPPANEEGDAIRVLQAVQSADDYMEEFTVHSNSNFSYEQWLAFFYYAAAAVIFFSLLFSLYKIKSLITNWGAQKLGRIHFVNTAEKGTPFTFLNYIFWNKAIPLHSESGQQIFKHELVHAEEHHTLDKLFLQATLIPFWCNPFFWLIKRELQFIHEFIADKKSVTPNRLTAFAAMVLHATYPTQYQSIVNPFFQSSIKRRIAMLTKTANPKLAYTGRIVALPLIAVLLFAFSVRTKPNHKSVNLEKEVVVVIDAGHGYEGGKPSGVEVDGANESDLVLSLAEKIKTLNTNRKLKLVFTRLGKDWIGLKERVALAENANADIFISLHINAAENNTDKGIEVLVPTNNKTNNSQSKLLASAIIASLGKVYTVSNHPLQQRSGSAYVLENSPCPAVLVEVGYLTNTEDRNFIQSDNNQERIANQLLKAIENYAAGSVE